MRLIACTILLSFSLCFAQDETLTVPAGTRVPLTLCSPVTAKVRPGDAARAVVAFPVTVGSDLAIPAGAYVEGDIVKLSKRGRNGPSLQIHFTRVLYANGYTVSIDGANAVAQAVSPDSNMRSSFVPDNPPLPKVGPSIGTVTGIAAGASAGIVALVLWAHHRGGGGDTVLFGSGWQFDMVLQGPLLVREREAGLIPH